VVYYNRQPDPSAARDEAITTKKEDREQTIRSDILVAQAKGRRQRGKSRPKMQVSSEIRVKEVLEDEDIGILEDPLKQNRRIALHQQGSVPSFSASLPTKEDSGHERGEGASHSRKASIEVPIAISTEDGVKIVPSARMSMQSKFPLGSSSSKRLSGRVQASAVVRGFTGYTSQEAAVKYEMGKNSSLETGLSKVRSQHRVYMESRSALSRSSHVSARYSQLVATPGRRGAHASLTGSQTFSYGTLSSTCAVPLVQGSPSSVSLALSTKTVHPWRFNLGWNQLHKLSWQWSLSPKLSDYQSLRLSLGQGRKGLWSWSGNFVQKIKSATSFSVAVSYQASRGVFWIFSWTNGDLYLNVPVSFLDFDDVSAPFQTMFLAGLTKVIQDAIAMALRLDKVAAESIDMEKKKVASRSESSRKDALDQQELMKRQARSRTKLESEKNRLVIQSATYYLPGSPQDESLDVTVALQFWVNDGSLELPAASKKDLLGFFDLRSSSSTNTTDPVVKTESIFSRKWWAGFVSLPGTKGRAKSTKPLIRIIYEFRGTKNEIVVQDEEKLVLPR
jgi:hypothetical protein